MISAVLSRLVILLFGTLYPAYASYKAIRTKNVKEYVKWMMYWIVFALFTCAETFTDVFLSWLPFYYEIKIILVFWLLSPATKGSSILYRKFVHPALCRREQEIDECISKAKEQGYHTVLNLGSRGVNYATNVIMQTALKHINNQPANPAPSPSARRPLSSVSPYRDSYVQQPIVEIPEINNQDLMFDEIDSIPLSELSRFTFTTQPKIVEVSNHEVPVEVAPAKNRQARKKKSTTATKRSNSAGRKTRKQTALEKAANDNIIEVN